MTEARERVMQAAEKAVARGKISQAIREYRKLLRQNPNDANMLNRVGDLYARQDKVDEAVELFQRIAEDYSRDGFFVKAIAIYKKIIRLDPTQLEVYERLAELYHRQGLISESRSQYLVLVDYYTKHNDMAATIEIHRKMAELEPNDPSPRVKLAELYLREGLIEETIGEYQRIAELMLDHGRVEEATKVYLRALEVDCEDLAFVSEAVMRLHEDGEPAAAEQVLAAAVELNPEAARLAERMREHAAKEAEPEPAVESVEAETERKEVQPEASVASTDSVDMADLLEGTSAAEADADETFVIGLEEEDLDDDVSGTVDELAAQALSGADVEAGAVGDELEIDLTELEEVEAEEGGESSLEALAESLGLSTEAEAAVEPAPPSPEPQPSGARAPEPASTQTELDELLAEAEVFAKYGLETKALRRLEQALEIDPDNFPAQRRLVLLQLARGSEADVISAAQSLLDREDIAGGRSWEEVLEALASAGYSVVDGRVRRAATEGGESSGGAPAGGEAAAERPVEEDEEGLEWLDTASADKKAPQELFEVEEEFFDLAAEIEKGLAEESPASSRDLTDVGRGGDESLEEIVEGFKQGVAEVLSPDAYATHYNLGIAYREMGLVDEAIGEFQLCSKDPDHLIDSCSMLGACFQEKGFPDLAVKWYRRGLDAPSIDEEGSLSLLYDLGSVYAAAGEREAAYEVFVEIYGVNSHYRDVVARLEELRG